MSELILENEYLKVTFPGNKAGFSGIWLKNYQSGSAIKTEYNRLDENLYYKAFGGDYHGVYAEEQEYWSGDVNGIAYKTTMGSTDLFGKADIFGNSPREVVKVVSGDVVEINSDRAINSQELLYYFSPDGQSLIKRVRLNIRKQGANAENLQSVVFMNYVGFAPVAYNSEIQYIAFHEYILGFNSLDNWSADSGLGISLARNSLYPNLAPGFSEAQWQIDAGQPVISSNRQLNLSGGDNIYLCRHNAYPADRIHTLNLSVQNLSGSLRIKYGLSRNAISCDEEAQSLDITSNGSYSLQDNSGYGDNYLYIRLEQLSGSGEVHDLAVKYLKDGVSYSDYDHSYLAHTSLHNCARVQSVNPNGLRLIYNFPQNIKIAAGGGVKMLALSLDNNSIEDGAFCLIFQKPDDTWVETGKINMLVDFNDQYPLGAWGRFNQWDDSFFGVEIPANVNEIKAIGIKWTTNQAIDWLLDGFGIVAWQDKDLGSGTQEKLKMGLPAQGLRLNRTFTLRGVQGAYHPVQNRIPGERISVVIVGGLQGYGEYVPLTFQNIQTVNEVYQISNQYIDSIWNQWNDNCFQLVYNASGINNYLYPVAVRNVTQNEEYPIISSAANLITVDIGNKNYALSDTLRITYARKQTVDPAHWDLAQNARGQWCIKWAYDSWTLENDRQKVYVDYSVAGRSDDSPAWLLSASNHDVHSIVQDYPDISNDSPQLAAYATYVFSDPSNEQAEGLFIYQPRLNKSGDALYTEAQNLLDLADLLYLNTRQEALSPMPKNYNLIPMLAFGGEAVAANPIDYLQQVSRLFFSANATNAIMATGSLNHLYDRDMQAWWNWSGALRDSGVNYLSASRQILRRGYPESIVGQNLNRHRYFFEVSVFADSHIKRHKEQAALDYKGNLAYKRTWYYQEANGAYTAVTHPWNDFQAAYYQPIVLNGKSYIYRYNYTETIPAFWSVVKPSAYWGLANPTIYDLLCRRIDYLCRTYDSEGILLSELLYYGYSFDTKDFALYNWWRQNIKGLASASDWPRDVATGYVMVDDPLIWEFKSYYIKEMLTNLAAIAHGHNKLFGCNVQVQNCLPVKQPDAPVWEPYTKKSGTYGVCVDTLNFSCDRYGTPYADLLQANICDLLFVWLYYRYSSFGIKAAYDFIERFSQYKERMLVTVGLFPKENPPAADEIIQLVQTLLQAGFNVCYAGYPPMLINDERWVDVWGTLSNYVPLVTLNEDGEVEVNPKQVEAVPFLIKM
ncbi:MAG: hypothetical protein HZA78_10540 [Candidatus Schekmanbacteria bacterium]|nr:hypothetical protein [Candidatus Schekmanbacteria bacterium]